MIERKTSRKRMLLLLYTAAACFLLAAGLRGTTAQEAQQKPSAEPANKSAEKTDKSEKPAHPAQIELLETKVRFEANGDSRKEVHALVKIHSELGVRQFAQLNFDFNRSFETAEIPMVHITHANGGTSDILASAVTDHPNPAVVNFPAYQDVRVKSVRILGLQPGDTLEYRVIRTVSHHPLAPDFWLVHTFDRTGVVSKEIFEIDLPASRLADSSNLRRVEMQINPATPAETRATTDTDGTARSIRRWQISTPEARKEGHPEPEDEPDIALGSFLVWGVLSQRLAVLFGPPPGSISSAISDKAIDLTKALTNPKDKAEALYDFVSAKIATVDLPLDATGFRPRPSQEILSSGYATSEDKFVLLAALNSSLNFVLEAALAGTSPNLPSKLPTPSLFSRVLTRSFYWCDPSLEVAPFGLLPAELRGKKVFRVFDPPPSNPLDDVAYPLWLTIPKELPFAATQSVQVSASLGQDGKLSAKVGYSMRGDNELVLREAFHRTPKERWKEVAQLLSITDGFRGQVTGVNASDPYATKEPFSVEYELDQPKFVDWLKKPVRIPALLPQFGLPDSPAKPASGSATAPIELGTPLEVETKMTLHLPPGTGASAPAGTSVERDYATYSSQYAVNGSTLTATRRIKFVLREVPAARAADYNAFLRAVQNDEAQDFTLESPRGAAPKTNSAGPNAATPPKPAAPKP